MLDKRISLIIIVILLIGLGLTAYLVQNSTQTQQEASQIENINTGSEITNTKNSDSTMGPDNASKNYSSTLKKEELGSLTFSVIDPIQVAQNTLLPTGIPTITGSLNAPRNSTASAPKQGTQKVKSLIVTVKKIEVHLKRSANKSDVWETLNMPQPISMDLVQLIEGGVVNLGLTELVAGEYSEVRVYIQSANATLENSQVVNLALKDRDPIIRVVKDFTIDKGKNTNLILDFDAMNSVIYTGKEYLLRPVIAKLLVNK